MYVYEFPVCDRQLRGSLRLTVSKDLVLGYLALLLWVQGWPDHHSSGSMQQRGCRLHSGQEKERWGREEAESWIHNSSINRFIERNIQQKLDGMDLCFTVVWGNTCWNVINSHFGFYKKIADYILKSKGNTHAHCCLELGTFVKLYEILHVFEQVWTCSSYNAWREGLGVTVQGPSESSIVRVGQRICTFHSCPDAAAPNTTLRITNLEYSEVFQVRDPQ